MAFSPSLDRSLECTFLGKMEVILHGAQDRRSVCCATPRAPPVLSSGFAAGDEKLQQRSLSETPDFPETWAKPLWNPPSGINKP